MEPTQHVCPDCGEVAGGQPFCASCGRNLTTVERLPSRSEWEAAQRDEASRSDAALVTAPPRADVKANAEPSGADPQRRRLGAWIALAAVVGALLVGAVMIVLLSSGTDKSKPTAQSDDGPPAEQRCIDLWNSEQSDANLGKTLITGGALGAGQSLYGSVGFAADFPDRCLYTFANPETQSMFQIIEGAAGGTNGNLGVPQSGSIDELPESVKDWNLDVSEDGELTLKSSAQPSAPASESQTPTDCGDDPRC